MMSWLRVREEVYAAIRFAASFHCGVEDIADTEEIGEEKKSKAQVAQQKQNPGRPHRGAEEDAEGKAGLSGRR